LLKGVKPGKDGQFTALCPGHDDRNRSLSIKQTDGKLLLKCFAGCETAAILKPLGLVTKDLFLNGHKPKAEQRVIEAVYHYDGFEVVRTNPKGFYQRRPDGKGGYINNLKGITPTLYHADELPEAIAAGKTIYVVEGEKDTDNVRKLGMAATCNPMGAGKWRDSYSEALRGADLIIIPDADGPGRDHAAQVARSCYGKAARIRVLELPSDSKDVSKWLDNGGDVEQLRRLASQCPEYEPSTDITPHAPRGYIITDDKGKQALDIEALINDLLADFHFATLRDNDEVLIYRDSYYQPQGKRFIKSECQCRVGVSSLLTEHKVNEIIGHITRSTYVDRKDFNADKFTLNLTNGLLDTRTHELRPHTPDYLSTIRIPETYDANADCPVIRKFLTEVHHSQDIPVVEEIAGYCLTPDNSIQKAILIVGGGDQGKSTELSLFKAFIGADNCSNVPWHALELNRFAMSALEGKLANIFADLPSQSLSMVSVFKMLTGGDTIGTEKKFGDYYSFVNYAKLIFSANKPPKVQDEDSYAFWRRWIILDFPNQIPEDKKDVNILDKLITPAELSGFLNIALDGLARLRAARRFSYDKSVEATTEYYLRAADPVYAFLQDCVEASPKDWVTKDDLYDAFQEYCVTQCLPVSKPNSFARSLQNQAAYRISSTRPEVDRKRVTAWQWIKISVKDVKDVNVFSLPKGHAQGDDNIHNNIQMDIKIGKNVGNLDAIASITHDHQNPDANDLPDCPTCGRNEWTYSPDGDLLCPCGKSLKGGEQ